MTPPTRMTSAIYSQFSLRRSNRRDRSQSRGPHGHAGPCSSFDIPLLAGSAMAAAVGRAAVAGLSHLAVRPNAGLSQGAPEEAVIRARDGRIRLGPDILALPMQSRTQARALSIETIRNFAHAAPPALVSSRGASARSWCPHAARMARFTATRAKVIFCWLWPRLRAALTAASAA